MLRGRAHEDRNLSSIAKIGNRLISGDARIVYVVIPAKAGTHCLLTVARWIPAFAGMTF
jgi:hypothetical protein